MVSVALVGAGGKMGSRITDNLRHENYAVSYVEVSEPGQARLREKGLTVTALDVAVAHSDLVILAVPDVAIRTVAGQVVPLMKSGATLITLDPAAAYLGHLPTRDDVSYFVAHPCHPSVFGYEAEYEARRDFFGGHLAKQAIVCTLIQGPDEDYAVAEDLAKKMYKPVTRAHKITLEQMALLEPAMAETVGATVAELLKEAMDEAVQKGVPAEAARDFMLGHINILFAVMFGEAGNPVSDACKVAMQYGKRHLIQPGWKGLFERESVAEQIRVMLNPEELETAVK
jgi:D-apionate oxidoisomerase